MPKSKAWAVLRYWQRREMSGTELAVTCFSGDPAKHPRGRIGDVQVEHRTTGNDTKFTGRHYHKPSWYTLPRYRPTESIVAVRTLTRIGPHLPGPSQTGRCQHKRARRLSSDSHFACGPRAHAALVPPASVARAETGGSMEMSDVAASPTRLLGDVRYPPTRLRCKLSDVVASPTRLLGDVRYPPTRLLCKMSDVAARCHAVLSPYALAMRRVVPAYVLAMRCPLHPASHVPADAVRRGRGPVHQSGPY
eukprot:3142703-Rhodomonas_salina.3